MWTLWIWLLSCGGPIEITAPPPPAPPAPDAQAMAIAMGDHYRLADQAQDAFVAGDLDGMRTALDELSTTPLPAPTPDEWLPYHEALYDAAAMGALAETREAAARYMGEVAAACGGCHTALKRGPVFIEAEKPAGTMDAHEWAAEQLWHGVITPSDAAWARGLDALEHSRVYRGSRVIRAVREASGASRAVQYGTLLANCGDCHRKSGVHPH